MAEYENGVLARALRHQAQARRYFLRDCISGLGALFLGSAARPLLAAGDTSRLDFARDLAAPLIPLPPQFPARVRRVIFLHMSGAPSQFELFDHKPELNRLHGEDCPASFLAGKPRSSNKTETKILGSIYPFHQSGQSGAWISDRLPHLEKHLDDLCFIHSMRSDTPEHNQAQLQLLTGDIRLGHPSLGSWVTYGLGTENQNLPGFVVLVSRHFAEGAVAAGKALWNSAFLPGAYQGVECRSHGEPVLYLKNPQGVGRPLRRRVLDAIDEINRGTYTTFGDPETVARIAQYEMAFRMQLAASDAMDIQKEPPSVRDRYGAVPGANSFANNCLLARRLAERGVRFIELHHSDWDTHGVQGANFALNFGFKDMCRDVDKPIAAFLSDLKSRGLWEDTLVVWAGEFGRTPFAQGKPDAAHLGRNHHNDAFTIWLAGGGLKAGIRYGQTDELGLTVVKDPVETRDLHATMLYLLGFDHRKLSYAYQGLDQKLTGVKPARVVAEILA